MTGLLTTGNIETMTAVVAMTDNIWTNHLRERPRVRL